MMEKNLKFQPEKVHTWKEKEQIISFCYKLKFPHNFLI